MKTNWSAVFNVCLTTVAWFLAGFLVSYGTTGSGKGALMAGCTAAGAALVNHLRQRPQISQPDAPQMIQIPPKP